MHSVPRTEVPAARNSLRESTKRSTAQRVTKGPSSPSVDGTKGSGQEWFSAIPNRIADRNAIGGRSKPGSGPPPGPRLSVVAHSLGRIRPGISFFCFSGISALLRSKSIRRLRKRHQSPAEFSVATPCHGVARKYSRFRAVLKQSTRWSMFI